MSGLSRSRSTLTVSSRCTSRSGAPSWSRPGTAEISCAPGTMIFRPAEMRHADRMGTEDVRFFILEVERREVAGVAVDWPKETSASLGIASARALALFRAFREDDPSVALAAEELCLALLDETRREAPPDCLSASGRRVADAADFIRANFRRPLRAEEIARAAGVHPVHLARLFRRRYGCSALPFRPAREGSRTRSRAFGAATNRSLGDRPVERVRRPEPLHARIRPETGLAPAGFRRAARGRVGGGRGRRGG